MITIVLQYHTGDYDRAMELARFIAEIEAVPRDSVKFMFFGRWDAPDVDTQTLALVGAKFRVACRKTSLYKWDGWPAGPNGIAKEVLLTAPSWLWQYFGVVPEDGPLLLIEPDCVPFARDWLSQLASDWSSLGFNYATARGVWQIGAWRNSGGEHGHVNGNCLIRADIRNVVPVVDITQHCAWDCELAPYLRDHWLHSWLFVNHFHSTAATIEVLPKSAVLVHGYKDRSAIDLAKAKLL